MQNNTGLAWLPQDLSFSNDGALAVVRTVKLTSLAFPTPLGFVYVWDMSTDPPSLALAESHPSNAEGGDIALALDDVVLTLAVNVNDNGTVLDDLRIWSIAGGGGSLLGAGAWLSDCWDARVLYGGVGMGPLAAVRHREYGVSLWDLATGQPLAPVSNFPLPAFNSASPCFPGFVAGDAFGLADSIELTSTRIVSIANPWQPGAAASYTDHFRAAIGIAEFQGMPSWPRSYLTHPFSSSCDQGAPAYYWVHDLAISPDGSKCVVSGTDYIGAFNINRGVEIGALKGTAYPTPSFYNLKGIATLDSVEMTNTRAVVIGNEYRWNQPFNSYQLPTYSPAPPLDNEAFEICVLSLKGDTIFDDRVWNAAALLPGLPTPRRARACDLAITPNQSKAIVSTRRATIVFDLTQAVASMTPQVLLTTADPMNFAPGQAQPSDVVACTDTRAVVIGRRPKAGAPLGTTEGVIEVLDLMPAQLVPPAPPALASILSSVAIGDFYIPTDVAITPNGARAIVRSNRPDLNNDADVRVSRITVVELLTGTVEFQTDDSHGPLGVARGKDHLECTNEWVVSAGETSSSQCSVQFLRLP